MQPLNFHLSKDFFVRGAELLHSLASGRTGGTNGEPPLLVGAWLAVPAPLLTRASDCLLHRNASSSKLVSSSQTCQWEQRTWSMNCVNLQGYQKDSPLFDFCMISFEVVKCLLKVAKLTKLGLHFFPQ